MLIALAWRMRLLVTDGSGVTGVAHSNKKVAAGAEVCIVTHPTAAPASVYMVK